MSFKLICGKDTSRTLLQCLFFHGHKLCDEPVVDPVTTNIMRKDLESGVKSCAFVEKVTPSRISVLQVFLNGSFDLTHSWTVFPISFHRVEHCGFEWQENRH